MQAMKLTIKKTRVSRGYLGANAVQYTIVVPDKNRDNSNLCPVGWDQKDADTLYLDSSNAAFQKRQLGLGYGQACWGIPSPGGWRERLIYHPDHTIEAKDRPGRFLCSPEGQDGVFWSNDGNDPAILTCVMEDF